MFSSLFSTPYFALFVIVTIGFMVGKIKVKGVSLDVSAVIFIALLFGHFGVQIPSALSDFGMVLFIFTIGIQAGPGFAASFKSKGKTLVFLSLIIIASATIVAVVLQHIFNFSASETTGLLTGALTSTPGLATARELTGDSTAVAYGVAYPFGVIGVILFVKLLPKVLRIDLKKIEQENERAKAIQFPKIGRAVYRITNKAVFEKSLVDLSIRSTTGAVVSGIKHGEQFMAVSPHTILQENDLIRAVGTEDALEKIRIMLGEKTDEDVKEKESQDFERSIGLVTNKSLVGRTLSSLNVQMIFGCTITRIHRSGIELTPSPDLTLKFGDKLTIVGTKDNMSQMLSLIGNDKKQLSDTDFFPIALGIVLGVLFGKLSLNFGSGFSFSFGLTGGILIVALFLSSRGRTGNIMWTMSEGSNNLLRQLGLILFLAGVGTSAGRTVVESFLSDGVSMFVSGALITIIPMVCALLASKYIFKVGILDLLGVITGGMTSTPGLAAADSMTTSSAPSIAYATVYPVAMVFLILCVQLIALLS